MIRNRFSYAAGAVALALTGLGVVGFTGSRPAQSSEHSSGSSASASSAGATVSLWSGKNRPNPYAFLPKAPSFKVSSTTVRNGRPLPLAQFSGVFGVPGGKDISPQLSWSGFPKGTKSFVVSMYDPEAPTGSGFWHWVVADLPAGTKSLPENAGALNSKDLPAGAFQLNGDAGTPRYIGAAPPAHSGEHDYYVTVTALNVAKTGVGPTTSGALLGFTIDPHVIGRATLVFPTFAR
ncbi:YbhB/YbcL family Raf kinase inhibitor-like protein [Streptacidiphilus sp. PAMC 29251]